MIPYWLLFVIPAFFALTKPTKRWSQNTSILIWTTLSIFIGLRFAVGGDWLNYMLLYEQMSNTNDSLISILGKRDALYVLVNWFSSRLGLTMYGVNLICAMIFSGGLVYFCRNTPRPWLALTVAIPYLVIAVSMGYTRQSVGIGILMYGYIALEKGKIFRFFQYILAAVYFHLTSVVMLPLVVPYLYGFDKKDFAKRLNNIILFTGGAIVIFLYYVQDALRSLVYGYIYNTVESGGAIIRVGLNLIPAIIFLIYGHRLQLTREANSVWKWLSISCVIFALGLIFFPKSTIIDRVALYAIPIQLFVASRLPDLKILRLPTSIINTIVVIFAGLVQYVWLFYGSFSAAWLPYENILFR